MSGPAFDSYDGNVGVPGTNWNTIIAGSNFRICNSYILRTTYMDAVGIWAISWSSYGHILNNNVGTLKNFDVEAFAIHHVEVLRHWVIWCEKYKRLRTHMKQMYMDDQFLIHKTDKFVKLFFKASDVIWLNYHLRQEAWYHHQSYHPWVSMQIPLGRQEFQGQ